MEQKLDIDEHDYKTKKESSTASFILGICLFFGVFIIGVFSIYGVRTSRVSHAEDDEETEYDYLYGDTTQNSSEKEEHASVFYEGNTYSDWEGMPPEKIGESYKSQGDDCLFYLNEKIGYRLFVVDAAAGSRFYDFEKTEDGGYTWTVINEDPFNGQVGVAREMNFDTKGCGTITLQSPGDGDSWKITMKTEDSGHTFSLETEENFEQEAD